MGRLRLRFALAIWLSRVIQALSHVLDFPLQAAQLLPEFKYDLVLLGHMALQPRKTAFAAPSEPETSSGGLEIAA